MGRNGRRAQSTEIFSTRQTTAASVPQSLAAKHANKMLALLWSLGLLSTAMITNTLSRQNCEGTSDAVNDNGEDLTHLESDILRFAFHSSIWKLAGNVCGIHAGEVGHTAWDDCMEWHRRPQ